MLDFDRDQDGEAQSGAPRIEGGLLDPRTFPSYLLNKGAGPAPAPTEDEITRAQVEADIRKAQAALPPLKPEDIHGILSQISGPLRTDVHPEMWQNILNAQAGLPQIKPGPETWSINGQPYMALSANTYDPARSSHVTSMPTPEQSATAFAGRKLMEVKDGRRENIGYLVQPPARMVLSVGKTTTTDGATTETYSVPFGAPRIHGHIDGGRFKSFGPVDKPGESDGYGDAQSLMSPVPAPTATVSHQQVSWHVLDDGRLKFFFPPGSLNFEQTGQLQHNLDEEQQTYQRAR